MKLKTAHDQIEKSFGREDMLELTDILRSMHLPLLEADGLPLENRGDLYLLFCNSYGFNIRVVGDLEEDLLQHDLIAQPWLEIELANCAIKFYANLQGASAVPRDKVEKDEESLQATLIAEGITSSEIEKHNFGYVRVPPDIFDGKMPVIFDHNAYSRRRYKRELFHHRFNKASFEGVQQRIYDPFIEALQDAYNPATKRFNIDKLIRFLKLCYQEVKKPGREKTLYTLSSHLLMQPDTAMRANSYQKLLADHNQMVLEADL